MKRLPSGLLINFDLVTSVGDLTTAVLVSFGHPDMDLQLLGADAEMVRAWSAKRPLLVPPSKNTKVGP